MNIALFGGSFNPPHQGHAAVLRHLGELKDADRKERFQEIWLVPTHLHAFNKPLIAFAERVALCKILLNDIQADKKRFKVVEIEKEFPAENRTVDTLRALHKKHPDHTFTLVLGSDLKEELPSWKEAATIPELAQIYFFPRIAGFSSTEIRQRLQEGKDVRTLVTPGIADYLEKNQSY